LNQKSLVFDAFRKLELLETKLMKRNILKIIAAKAREELNKLTNEHSNVYKI
jgi:hypothetical protein